MTKWQAETRRPGNVRAGTAWVSTKGRKRRKRSKRKEQGLGSIVVFVASTRPSPTTRPTVAGDQVQHVNATRHGR